MKAFLFDLDEESSENIRTATSKVARWSSVQGETEYARKWTIFRISIFTGPPTYLYFHQIHSDWEKRDLCAASTREAAIVDSCRSLPKNGANCAFPDKLTSIKWTKGCISRSLGLDISRKFGSQHQNAAARHRESFQVKREAGTMLPQHQRLHRSKLSSSLLPCSPCNLTPPFLYFSKKNFRSSRSDNRT